MKRKSTQNQEPIKQVILDITNKAGYINGIQYMNGYNFDKDICYSLVNLRANGDKEYMCMISGQLAFKRITDIAKCKKVHLMDRGNGKEFMKRYLALGVKHLVLYNISDEKYLFDSEDLS